MKYFEKISGKRIYLAPMHLEDAEQYTKWMNDYAVTGYLGNYSVPISLSSEQKVVEHMASEGQNFAIVLREGDQLLGNISLEELNHINRTATVGLFIGEAEHRGKGYGTEALNLIVNYGFDYLNLNNMMLTVHADNERGIACYRKVGFIEFGRRHNAVFKNGKYLDMVYMELFRS